MYSKLMTAFIILAVTAGPALGQGTPQNNTNVTVDLTKLDASTQATILNQIKKESQGTVSEVAKNVTPDEVQKWSAIGKGLGDAIASAAKALNTGVNDFIKTPAGILVVWAIFGYLFGGTLMHIVFVPIVWFVLMFTIWRSMRIWLRPNIKTLKDGTVIDTTFVWTNKDGKSLCMFFHFAAMIVTSIVMLIILFS
jgi:hypothetical protein